MNNKNKTAVIAILAVLAFSSFTNPKSEASQNHMITKKKETKDGAIHYRKNFKQFDYYIETIGTVSIDNVVLKNGKLTALYSYNQGSEVRSVVSILNLDSDGIYKGTCTTKVNEQTLFVVNTWITFTKDGTATGNWSWSGSPSKNDPIVTISNKN